MTQSPWSKALCAFHVVSVMQRELPSSEERAQAGAVWSLCVGRGPRPALVFSHPI